MKTPAFIICLAAASAILLSVITLLPSKARDAQSDNPGAFEYATLRWAGRENTHLIRPNGAVEFLGRSLMPIKRPDRADDRSFYMNIAMNVLAKEGYELVAMTPDDYVFKRKLRPTLQGNL
jgi:hypothetical protein